MASDDRNINAGHRQRMYTRFERNGCSFETFQPHEVLEMLLFMFIPQANTNQTAHMLLNRFGTLENVFKAPIDQLSEIKGISTMTAARLRFLGEIFAMLEKDLFSKK